MRPRLYVTIGACPLMVAALLASCVSDEVLEVRRLPIEHIDLGETRDGQFDGEYSYGSFTYIVRVTLRGHVIQSIDVIANRDTEHALAAEGVVAKVIEEQRNDVDVVSGATTTSKALLKAIEEALRKAL